MAEQPGLDTSPFFFAGGPIGCLLIRGFTSAPPETRPMGEYLAGRGLTVLGLRLPGHGATPDDLIRTNWRDWVAAAERGLADLEGRCQRVFVAGVSMGGLLTLYLAERHPVAGLIPMAAALDVASRRFNWAPLLQYCIKAVPKGPPEAGDWVDPTAYLHHWSYSVYPIKSVADMISLRRRVRAHIAAVTAPTLIIHGLRDAAVPPASAQWLYDHISSPAKSILWLPDSGHCVTIDAERQRVWQSAYDFIQAYA